MHSLDEADELVRQSSGVRQRVGHRLTVSPDGCDTPREVTLVAWPARAPVAPAPEPHTASGYAET